MFDILGRLVLQLHGQIDNPDTLLHVGSSDISDPAWNRGRKEEDLQIFATLSSACSEDLFKFEQSQKSFKKDQKSLTLSISSLKPCLSI